MSRTECVILAFRTLGKTAYAVPHPVLTECLTPARDYFMGIRLMSHVKNDLVRRRVIDIMQPHDKFHSTEA